MRYSSNGISGGWKRVDDTCCKQSSAGIKEPTDRHAITTKDQQNWNSHEKLGVKETRVCPTNVSLFTMFIPCIVTLITTQNQPNAHLL